MVDFKNIINKYASPTSRNRGENIFEADNVEGLVYDEYENGISISSYVIGNHGLYHCQLEVELGDLEEAYCTCPYDYGDICKHLVATLLAANEAHIKHNTISPKHINSQKESTINLPAKKTTEPFIVSIDKEQLNLKDYEELSIYRDAINKTYAIKDLQLAGNAVEIVVPDDQYWSDKITEVRLEPSNESSTVMVTSVPVGKKKRPTLEELAALIYIRNNGLESIFQLFNPEKRTQLLLKTAGLYGIKDLDKAEKYFEQHPKNFKQPFQLKKAYSGLVPLNNSFQIEANPQIFLKQPEEQENTLLREVKQQKDGYELNFFITMEARDNPFSILTITPFIAKLKANGEFYKTGIKSYYDLSYFDNIPLTDQQSELVDACKILQPGQFANRLGSAIRKIDDSYERSFFILTENLKQIGQVWPGFPSENFFLKNPAGYNFKISADDLTPIEPSQIRPTIRMELHHKEEGVILEPIIQLSPSKSVKLKHKSIFWLHSIAFCFKDKIYILSSAEDALLLHNTFKDRDNFITVAEAFPSFFTEIVLPISKRYPIDIKSLPPNITNKEIEMQPTSKSLYLRELDKFILMRPMIGYGDEEINVLDSPYALLNLKKDSLEIKSRDEQAEKLFIEEVASLNKKFDPKTNNSFFNLHLDDFVKDYWFLGMFEQAKKMGIEIYGFNDFKNFNFSPHTPKVQVNASSGVDWFDLEIKVTVGDSNISLKEVRKALLTKEKYIKLGDGKLAVLPEEWVKKLEKYLRLGKVEKDSVQVSKLRFNVLDELFDELDQSEILAEIQQKKQKLSDFQKIQEVEVPGINATLRHYQHDGYQWLHFLHEFGWGGILADDMGLGKTLQVITFIKSMVDGGINNHLIVVPTTLLFNWKNEIEKFCPELTYHIYHGTNREREKPEFDKYNLVITTYGLLISDIKLLQKMQFGYVILDESQAIKNPGSKRFKAALLLKAQNKIAMTGTPIENNTFDLYAQMTFVNPGLFISAEHFRKHYATPIDKDGDKIAADELNKTIHPFILRRTKEMVAKELPPKIEDIIYCQMEEEQRKVYDAYRNSYRKELLGMIEEEGLAKSKLHVLQALTKLRQVCNSPALLNEEENYGSQSVKIKELLRHMQEKTGNHKLLVFSQFVGMLKLIEKELLKLKIPYSYLDGQSTQKKRKEAVDNFQEQEDVRVFLISLKAGGTGLNLTAADYVYIVDPWWNPAAENQAIDRCYRIGQDKKVIAYRMICVDTLEEKIMKYKSQKQSVADAIIRTDENVMKQISKEDIMDIFS